MFRRIIRTFTKKAKLTFDSKTILVVVDMQPCFEAAKCNKTASAVLALIDKAKKANSLIVILEYNLHGPTRTDITDSIRSYANHKIAGKDTDGGGKEVEQFINGHNRAILCGVNYGACVFHTASELKKIIDVRVVKNACNQPSYWSYNMDDYTKKYIEEVGKDCVIQYA